MSQTTPGPWAATMIAQYQWKIAGANGWVVAGLYRRDDGHQGFKDACGADALLIAQAPALREALKDALIVLDGFDAGVFVRDVTHDHESGWAVRALPYLAALGRVAAARAVLKACQPQ